jgi:hypothetical protein
VDANLPWRRQLRALAQNIYGMLKGVCIGRQQHVVETVGSLWLMLYPWRRLAAEAAA